MKALFVASQRLVFLIIVTLLLSAVEPVASAARRLPESQEVIGFYGNWSGAGDEYLVEVVMTTKRGVKVLAAKVELESLDGEAFWTSVATKHLAGREGWETYTAKFTGKRLDGRLKLNLYAQISVNGDRPTWVLVGTMYVGMYNIRR